MNIQTHIAAVVGRVIGIVPLADLLGLELGRARPVLHQPLLCVVALGLESRAPAPVLVRLGALRVLATAACPIIGLLLHLGPRASPPMLSRLVAGGRLMAHAVALIRALLVRLCGVVPVLPEPRAPAAMLCRFVAGGQLHAARRLARALLDAVLGRHFEKVADGLNVLRQVLRGNVAAIAKG